MASLEDCPVLFKKHDATLCLESESLRFLDGTKADTYGFLRTSLMMIHPVDQTPQPENVWDKAANAAEKDKSTMIRFILRGGRFPVQPNAVHRLADFFLTGFNRPHIYDAIYNGGGFMVCGGKSKSFEGCPFDVVLKYVLVVEQAGMGAGLKSTTQYKDGDTITFYFAKDRRGTAIHDDPVGR